MSCRVSDNMALIVSGMATDSFGTYRLLSSLLEIEGRRTTRGQKNKDSIQKLAKELLKTSWQKVLNNILVEPMDKSKHGNIESVRKTIMDHDEVFRQQVHELHRLYCVQKSLMAELEGGKHSLQSRTEETQEMVQDPRPNLKNSPSTSENCEKPQSAHLGNRQHSAPRQVPEHSFLQECKPATCLNLYGEETSRTQDGKPEGGRSSEVESWSASVESDLDLKLSIGPSSHATKAPQWLFSGSRGRNPSGQHR